MEKGFIREQKGIDRGQASAVIRLADKEHLELRIGLYQFRRW
jgi:hypothetical protein